MRSASVCLLSYSSPPPYIEFLPAPSPTSIIHSFVFRRKTNPFYLSFGDFLTMDVEEFSFPATVDSLPRLIDSPTLWRASRSISLSRRHSDDKVVPEEHEDDDEVKGHARGGSLSLDDDEEERMDMLWEGFNEEVLTLHRKVKSSKSEKETAGSFGCVGTWSISKANNTEKPGVVALLKVLRKLFLIHSHHRSTLKKGGQSRPHHR